MCHQQKVGCKRFCDLLGNLKDMFCEIMKIYGTRGKIANQVAASKFSSKFYSIPGVPEKGNGFDHG